MTAPHDFFLRCKKCGTKNRVPAAKIGQTAKCGKCKHPLDTKQLSMDTPIVATDANFEAEVIHSPLPVLLEFWASWCGPCQMLNPVIDQLARDWKGRARVAKLNMDENPYVASRFHVRSVPTLIIFDRGQLKDTVVGAASRGEIAKRMAPYL